jgi:hypothetical protein
MTKGNDMSSVNWVAANAKVNESEPAMVKVLGGDLPADHHLVKPGREMFDAVDLIKCLISEDYKSWSNIPEDKTAYECGPGESDVIAENMYHKFATTLGETKGSKYIKITTGGSVWGFIVNTKTDKKFKYGDLLKAAGWKAPARNFARGNVIDDTVESLRKNSVRWTGVRY